jgi:hypothetical protein
LKRLEKFVEEYESENMGEITFEVVPMQADLCVAGMLVIGDSGLIISGDSDFAMYVRPNGCLGEWLILCWRCQNVHVSVISFKAPVQVGKKRFAA